MGIREDDEKAVQNAMYDHAKHSEGIDGRRVQFDELARTALLTLEKRGWKPPYPRTF